MKRIFEKDSPSNVEVFENEEKISVKIRRTPREMFYGSTHQSRVAHSNSIVCKSALDHEGLEMFKKNRSNPHRFVLLSALLMYAILSLCVYLTTDMIVFVVYLIVSAVVCGYIYESSRNISDYLDQIQTRRNFKTIARYGISEYNVFIDFNKIKKTIYPSLDRELFSPKSHDMEEFSHTDTQPQINDCKPFPIDDTSTFIYDSTVSYDIKYRYGLRQSKFGFSLRVSNELYSKNYDDDPNISFVAILNEIITLVRGGDPKDDHQPFNPMD